jgi:hypothetical protein
MKKSKNTVSAIEALRMRNPENDVLKYSSSLDDITEEKGDMICLLRSKGMTKKGIAKKIHKSDRYVAAVLNYHFRSLGLPKVMTPSAKRLLLKERRAALRASKKK